MTEDAAYCQNCGVPVSKYYLSGLHQLWKITRADMMPLPSHKMSNLERLETNYRRKAAVVQWISTWYDTFAAMMKALPTVLIGDAALMLVSWNRADPWAGQSEIVQTAAIAFIPLMFLFISSIFLVRRLARSKATQERQAEPMLAELTGTYKLARLSLARCSKALPLLLKSDPLYKRLDGFGRLDRARLNIYWRSDVELNQQTQGNLEFNYGSITAQLDDLTALSVQFADLFDTYSKEFLERFRKWDRREKGEITDVSKYAMSAIVPAYWYFCGEVQNEVGMDSAQIADLFETSCRDFLLEFMRSAPDAPKSFVPLRVNPDLKVCATRARDIQRNVEEKISGLRATIKEIVQKSS